MRYAQGDALYHTRVEQGGEPVDHAGRPLQLDKGYAVTHYVGGIIVEGGPFDSISEFVRYQSETQRRERELGV